MTPGALAGYVLQGAGAALAWPIARRMSYHRRAALFLALYAAADVVRWALTALVLAAAARPFTGGARVVFHVDQALFLAQPLGLAALAWSVWADGASLHLAGAAALLFAVLVALYPGLRGAPLGHVYTVATLAAVALGVAAFLHWLRRRPGRWPTLTEAIVLTWLVAEAAAVVGPRLFDPAAWASADDVRHLRDGATVAIEVAWLSALRPQPPSGSSG